MVNTIGTEPGDIGMPMRDCRMPQIAGYKLEKAPNYRGKWLPSEKTQKIQVEISEAALQETFKMRELNQDLFYMK